MRPLPIDGSGPADCGGPLRWIGRLAIGLAAVSAVVAAARADDPPSPVDPASIAVDTDLPELLMAHNRERAEAGKPALEFDPLLTEAAAVQARDMAARGVMSHEGGDGSTPADRVRRAGYKFQSTAENVAKGYESTAELMTGWMNSPGHRANVLGDFAQIGLARAIAPDGTPFWAAEFGQPWPERDPETAAADLVSAINRARAEADKPALRTSRTLHQAAAEHARANAQRHELKQEDADGETPLDHIARNSRRFRVLAQSDASGIPHPEEVVSTWLAAAGQKDQLLGPFNEAGAGYATDETGKPYWTIILGRAR